MTWAVHLTFLVLFHDSFASSCTGEELHCTCTVWGSLTLKIWAASLETCTYGQHLSVIKRSCASHHRMHMEVSQCMSQRTDEIILWIVCCSAFRVNGTCAFLVRAACGSFISFLGSLCKFRAALATHSLLFHILYKFSPTLSFPEYFCHGGRKEDEPNVFLFTPYFGSIIREDNIGSVVEEGNPSHEHVLVQVVVLFALREIFRGVPVRAKQICEGKPSKDA